MLCGCALMREPPAASPLQPPDVTCSIRVLDLWTFVFYDVWSPTKWRSCSAAGGKRSIYTFELKFRGFVLVTAHCASRLSADSSRIFFPRLILVSFANKLHNVFLGTRITMISDASSDCVTSRLHKAPSSALILWLYHAICTHFQVLIIHNFVLSLKHVCLATTRTIYVVFCF